MSANDARRWNKKHRQHGFYPHTPSSLIVSLEGRLPPGGAALDVAGGSGRHALWLAEKGFEVTLTDISSVALEMAGEQARDRSLGLTTLQADFDQDPLPQGPWEVICCFHFLDRKLFPDFRHGLSDNGVLFFVQPTVRNLERHKHPSIKYLLEEGELSRLVRDAGLTVLHEEEGWLTEGRHEALVVAGL